MFTIGVENRKYDLHRPSGCTVLAIEVDGWPGNEFGLWLPEHVYVNKQSAWCNWAGNDILQEWTRTLDGRVQWKKPFKSCELLSELIPDDDNRCLWYKHTFTNTSGATLHDLSGDACFHLVNAPQFISIRGERIWACLDGKWTTTDKVPRHLSPDPRRISFMKHGLRKERTVVPTTIFPSALMAEAAHHPLIIAESFGAKWSVGIAARNFRNLFNNNDYILRCLHSSDHGIATLEPGKKASIDGIILFCNGDHNALIEQYEKAIAKGWPSSA